MIKLFFKSDAIDKFMICKSFLSVPIQKYNTMNSLFTLSFSLFIELHSIFY